MAQGSTTLDKNHSKQLSKSLFDTFQRDGRVSSKVIVGTVPGIDPHKVSSMRNHNAKIYYTSQADSYQQQQQRQSSSPMSKNDSEASRAFKKLKINMSSKLLIED